MTESHVPKKICVVGSGNWGSVIAKIVGLNVLGLSAEYVETVLMYVHEEIIDGAKLTDIINMKHENVKYLPGVKLPNNVRAHANPVEVCQDADVMIFVIPHQFLIPLCKQLAGKVKPTAVGVSLIKGLSESAGGKLDLISNTIRRALDIQCAVLMGANLAGEVASEFFCEATIGCRNALTGQMLKKLFQTPYFRIVVVRDEEAVEICGALKNVVAMGAGFVSGLGHGENTKAAVVRLGLMEIIEFCRRFFPGCKIETFLQSCGVADLVATCYGGRNRKVAEVFASINGAKTIQELEKEMLNGQKLQGPPTALEVHRALILKSEEDSADWCKRFPLFTMVHTVSTGQAKPDEFMQCLIDHPEHCH